MTMADLFLLIVLLEVAKIVELALLAIVLCSIWPRRTVRYYEDSDQVEERHEAIGLVDTERTQPTVLASGNREKAK